MLHVFDVGFVLTQTFRVPLHGGTVVPDLLLMKSTEKTGVAEEQTVLDQNDLRRRAVETGMILKQLIGKDQKGFVIRHRTLTSWLDGLWWIGMDAADQSNGSHDLAPEFEHIDDE
jgi:hypothetical protein